MTQGAVLLFAVVKQGRGRCSIVPNDVYTKVPSRVRDDFGSSRMMLVDKQNSEYKFIFVPDRLDEQLAVFERIIQDDQGGEALTKKSSFFLFHPYTVMAENPSSFLRQRTATLPFSPLLGDGREPSSFLRQRTATIFLFHHSLVMAENPLPSSGREPQQSSFSRQRTATLFLLPAENHNFLFHHTPQGGEALTKKSSFFLFHPYTVMAENPSSFLRQRTATLPFSPLLGDGREPSSFLRQRTATIFLFHHSLVMAENPLPSSGREPQQSSFSRQRTATLFLLPAENHNFLFHHTPVITLEKAPMDGFFSRRARGGDGEQLRFRRRDRRTTGGMTSSGPWRCFTRVRSNRWSGRAGELGNGMENLWELWGIVLNSWSQMGRSGKGSPIQVSSIATNGQDQLGQPLDGLQLAENLRLMLIKTPPEPPKSRDDDHRRRLESLLGATFVNPSQTPSHKILYLSPKLSLSFSKHFLSQLIESFCESFLRVFPVVHTCHWVEGKRGRAWEREEEACEGEFVRCSQRLLLAKVQSVFSVRHPGSLKTLEVSTSVRRNGSLPASGGSKRSDGSMPASGGSKRSSGSLPHRFGGKSIL
ncbi:hypothetical protein M5K25_006700 [Dendrobium thyrsiflorum]|uniref:Uncharacterized protein n=1 Tax=Dendrobium thyrsiflorum TaxID=117978 RepID=A0ABD0VJ54_DENTH